VNRTQETAPARPAPSRSPGTPWPAWPDGRILIRQAGGGDLGGLRDFLAGLSVRTRHLRFFAGAPASAAMIRVLAGQRPDADALVAIGNGEIIGHAMAVDTAGPPGATATEIGIVVADAWQGRGVGSWLLRALAGRARARGATTLAMDVLVENQRVLAMIAARWPAARHDRSGESVTVHARLE
jgi:GNAT superfamily N-acetyltransferase